MKNVSRKHVNQKVLTQSGPFRRKVSSRKRERCFMPIIVLNGVDGNAHWDLVLLVGVKWSPRCLSASSVWRRSTCAAVGRFSARRKHGDINRHCARGDANKLRGARRAYEPRTCSEHSVHEHSFFFDWHFQWMTQWLILIERLVHVHGCDNWIILFSVHVKSGFGIYDQSKLRWDWRNLFHVNTATDNKNLNSNQELEKMRDQTCWKTLQFIKYLLQIKSKALCSD